MQMTSPTRWVRKGLRLFATESAQRVHETRRRAYAADLRHFLEEDLDGRSRAGAPGAESPSDADANGGGPLGAD